MTVYLDGDDTFDGDEDLVNMTPEEAEEILKGRKDNDAESNQK